MKRFILVRTSENFGMGGANCIELHCTLLKDGSLSLRECIDQYSDGRHYFESIRGIRTPKQFIQALDGLEVMGEFRVEEILEQLFKKLPNFSVLTAVYHRISDNNNENEFFVKHYKIFKSITVDIPTNFEKSVSLYDAIYFYAYKWHKNKEGFPRGNHKILDREVVFP